jgi:hypothetical protein
MGLSLCRTESVPWRSNNRVYCQMSVVPCGGERDPCSPPAPCCEPSTLVHDVAGISGWIAARSDFLTMWEDVPLPDAERYTLVWESKVRRHSHMSAATCWPHHAFDDPSGTVGTSPMLTAMLAQQEGRMTVHTKSLFIPGTAGAERGGG